MDLNQQPPARNRNDSAPETSGGASLQTAPSSSGRTLHVFNTESASESGETNTSGYGFPDHDGQERQGSLDSPSSPARLRYSRFMTSSSGGAGSVGEGSRLPDMAESPDAPSLRNALTAGGTDNGSGTSFTFPIREVSGGQLAEIQPAESSDTASDRHTHPQRQGVQRQLAAAASAASAAAGTVQGQLAAAAAAAGAAADSAAAQIQQSLPQPEQLPVPLARVYHALWRGRPGTIGEPLVGSDHGSEGAQLLGGAARSGGDPMSRVASSMRINTSRAASLAALSRVASTVGLSHAASHRALQQLDSGAAAGRWEAMRPWLVAWLAASLITILVSWWWYALGCLVGAVGALGAISALRHKAGVDLIQPAKGAQFLGVLTGLMSAAATAVVVIALASVSCKYIPGRDCVRLRVMLTILAAWFAVLTSLSAFTAYRAYHLIQLLSPTFYWRQSEVAVPEPEEGGRVLLRQETFTPRASAHMHSSLDEV